MENHSETWRSIDKQAEYRGESDRLTSLFADSDEKTKALAAGLISDAAYLYAENKVLRAMLAEIGMVRVNPANPQQQRPVEAAKQFRANCDTYSSIIGRLSRMLDTQDDEEEDDMEDYEKDG